MRLHPSSLYCRYNVPTDPANGTKSAPEIGVPTTLRDNWLDNRPAGSVPKTNGDKGVTSGDFALYTAAETSHGNLTYSYWSYLNGPERHAYIVYHGAPPGAPGGGVSMEQYIASYLEAVA